jgi:hypothetical protein
LNLIEINQFHSERCIILSFFRKILGKSKIKQVRAESDLSFQKGLDERESTTVTATPQVRGRKNTSLQSQITLLEGKLNTPDTRSTPQNHIDIIRKLANAYLEMGEKEFVYYSRAENLYKQFNVLYPLHMEKMDWIAWIESNAKAKLIREARRLLQEARMLFPGDKDIDRIETTVLHISETSSSN